MSDSQSYVDSVALQEDRGRGKRARDDDDARSKAAAPCRSPAFLHAQKPPSSCFFLCSEKVEFFLGSPTSDQVVDAICERLKGKKAIVILDSNHAKSHVLNELALYGDFVQVGG